MLGHLLLHSRRRVSCASRSDLDAVAALSRLASRPGRWQHGYAAEEEPQAQAPASEAGPLALYEAGVSRGKYRSDPRQLVTVTKLQHLWQQLTSRTPGSESASTSGLTLVDAVDEGLGGRWKLWGLLTGKGGDAPAAESEHTVKGLYLYGGVGSGKTMLMDLFYDTLPPSVRKKRVHYHDFMLDVHRRLRELKAMEDPLRAVAENFMRSRGGGAAPGSPSVLCLDELMVTDVADAMILKRLFQHLFNGGLVLVSTSNRAPDRLYEGGLQRPLFLPFIALLKHRCEVHDIQGAQDYRMLARKLATPLYFTGPSASADLHVVLHVLAPGQTPEPAVIDVALGRTLRVPAAAGKVASFSFSALCEQPVAAADYIALCERYHTVLVDGLPRFDADNRAAAYRLVTLVDVAYEHRIRLVFAAAGPPAALFSNIMTQADYRAHTAGSPGEHGAAEVVVDDNVGFAKDRTISRIIEMGTLPYAREHARRYAPELLPSLPSGDAVV